MHNLARLAFLAAGVAFLATAADDAAGQPVIFGVVGAARADAQEAATLTAGSDVYKIVKDANGRKVASEARGRAVEVKGRVEERDGATWLAVTSCKIIEAVPAPPPARTSGHEKPPGANIQTK